MCYFKDPIGYPAPGAPQDRRASTLILAERERARVRVNVCLHAVAFAVYAIL